jgi:hypothetical protein
VLVVPVDQVHRGHRHVAHPGGELGQVLQPRLGRLLVQLVLGDGVGQCHAGDSNHCP